ncbi:MULTISPECIES: hypothetical protein [unclassified Bradyrhizobium]|uniref:Spy/CpxP family protein refolding chaperone n=1 Tax=unclassified Bradyrhizobium TaxID=2631580 RepID=UPI0024786A5B|nr:MULTISPECIES: hypothetical protein [unclassified Bradyrhizobium]WGR74776.1 hypothetical protein MTX24_18935 [Bradyrhizobium sp. ISRA426]WGR79611.1 hypothetical protein MTX21_04050 [Bradyrhizobium sp. ISRA430]WGR89948.1 hypothetical protein MTX25_18615 [Bradyrhizobium sp. ISRA432]
MKFIAAIVIFLVSASLWAQTPYAGMQLRQIKALSDQEIADLRAGRGMGLALAAEINGYPGPSHVLELADRLGLTSEQRGKVQEMFAAMRSEAIPLGSRLIDKEGELDQQFASGSVTPESLRAATAAISFIQGELRNAHLKYHLLTRAVLDKPQLDRYAELRGYAGGASMHHHHEE